ncbi:hypothetical protein CRUP_024161, partial [Coryphaenoides rupestris]
VCASAPLLSVAWDRVVLDEAHNIKNPKVQTSMAVCRLRAHARWAVTGQNNLLDMYSLLKCLPSRTCLVHRLNLTGEEQSVYDVIFAQTRHEGSDLSKANTSTPNPFLKGVSQSDPKGSISQKPQQASTTIHILSLLLRLRQCCSHLSLLKKTLNEKEIEGDGVVLSLEEQLNALSLNGALLLGPGPQDTVSLNRNHFAS